jgi:AcrR family transcriptional regulator
MTKTEIIDAAFKVWGRNFYRKTSLSQLAGELKVSKPALYRHFLNKENLTAAMIERFLDDFAESIRDDFQKSLQTDDADAGITIIVGSISGFFARNAYSLIFSLMNIYERNLDGHTIVQKLNSRGVDLTALQTVIKKKYNNETNESYVISTLVRLIFATLTFLMSNYSIDRNALKAPLSDSDTEEITSIICNTVKNGLGYPYEKGTINFDKLEQQIESNVPVFQAEPFFKAVAEAVAEAGPWGVTMEMVAKKLGLSKSSLYGHFKNKKDMLRRLFVSEFKKIIEYTKYGINQSKEPTEQLFLGILSIAVYLRSRPEILIAMDWIRTRKLDLGKPDKNLEVFRLFEDVDIKHLQIVTEKKEQTTSHWVLFLLLNILTHPDGSAANVQNNSIRLLYKYVILGLGGFNK